MYKSFSMELAGKTPVSYTHLDVYKRQTDGARSVPAVAARTEQREESKNSHNSNLFNRVLKNQSEFIQIKY